MVTYMLSQRMSWVIMRNDKDPVGLFGLRTPAIKKYRHGWLQTSTVLAPRYHGTGYNTTLKHAIASVAGPARLFASVADTNERSLRALEKCFPKAKRVDAWLPVSKQKGYVIEFPRTVCPPSGDGVARELKRWFDQDFAALHDH